MIGSMGLSSFATNIHSAVGPSAAGRAALVQDITSTPAINTHSLPPSKAGLPSATSSTKPTATAVKAAAAPASSSNTTVYIAAGVAALLVVGVVAVKMKKKKR